MLMIFNTKNLWLGRDLKRFNEIRDRLDEQHIPYRYRVRNAATVPHPHGAGRARFGSAGQPAEAAYEYEIRVRSRDLPDIRL